MNAIETHGLGKRYGRTWALRDCTVTIPAGRVVALIGPNGAGKTTLLQLAVGLIGQTCGEIAVLDGIAPGTPDALDGVAFVAQDTPLYKYLSVADTLRLVSNLSQHLGRSARPGPARRLGYPAAPQGGPAVRRPAGPGRPGGRAGYVILDCSSWTSRSPSSTRWPATTSCPPSWRRSPPMASRWCSPPTCCRSWSGSATT